MVVISFFFLMIRRPPISTRMTHSFPTRRSSDLGGWLLVRDAVKLPRHPEAPYPAGLKSAANTNDAPADAPVETPVEETVVDTAATDGAQERSEEHTSELQSLMRISYAVFCLKKKKKQQHKTHDDTHSNISHDRRPKQTT